MLRIEHRPLKYEYLFDDIDRGRIKIPQFQRDFVWSKEQTANLIDSIIKGFPIGTFIFWQARDELQSVRNIGDEDLPDTLNGDLTSYILDGQQRIASLYAVRKGLTLPRENPTLDYKEISIDLTLDSDDDEPVVVATPPSNGSCISVSKLLNSSGSALYREYGEGLNDKIEMYRDRLKGYNFAILVISDTPIDVACAIFTRINTAGTALTLFEIMVAKTYDETQEFNLRQAYDDLIDSNDASKDLKEAGFETVPSSIMLQCVAADICEAVRQKDILGINRLQFIERWQFVKDGLFSAIDYLRMNLRIPVSRLLPYPALLVPFTYFFIRNNGNPPNSDQDRWLRQYFWWASLSRRFTSSANSKIELDLKRMDNILADAPPSYQGEEVLLSLEDLKRAEFSTGDAFCKAILCLYAYFEPKSFSLNSIVKLDNSWLQRINSKNYHHFFPRNYLKNANFPNWFANNVLNITFVDDYLNKRIIGARAPSEYMREFKEQNPDIDSTMKTHLIDDLDAYGIWNDDYETFIKLRGERVLEELDRRLDQAGNVRREAP